MTHPKDEREFYKKMTAKSQDKYNSPEMDYDPNLYHRIVTSQHEYAPNQGETPTTYLIRLKIYQKLASETSTKTHIETAKGRPWYTHRSPQGCFICKQLELLSITISVLEYFITKYPKSTF